jgi:hypothetical protein
MSDTPPDSSGALEEALAAAGPGEPAGLLGARALVAGALFGADAAGLGRFRVLGRLGAGGMGTVYAAYDPDLDRSVALKLVPLVDFGLACAADAAFTCARNQAAERQYRGEPEFESPRELRIDEIWQWTGRRWGGLPDGTSIADHLSESEPLDK